MESHAHIENAHIHVPHLHTDKDVQDYIAEEKYIISLSQVLKLAPNSCMVGFCGAPVTRSVRRSGAALVIKFSCPLGHNVDWTSSPTHSDSSANSIFAINFLLANSVLLSGNNITKIEMMFRYLGLGNISQSLFFRYQKMYICPAVKKYWEMEEEAMMERLRIQPRNQLIIAGDGHCDSPGIIDMYMY